MFVDIVSIFIKAGNGGDGIVSFHREKYVPNGGPDGGDGGNGGSVVFETNDSMTTLADFKFKKHFRAENGMNGGAKNCTGRTAPDLIIKVPVGTVIKDKKTGSIVCDMYESGMKYTVLKGGEGGKGNAHYATAQRKAPNFSQQGVRTEEHEIILELKTIADVGLVGFPNVGKSTILSVTTGAKPKIANYHFTTLSPNLGVMSYYDNSCVIADIPGLIEGASDGVGLGHDFLRHIERVRLIVHVVDVSGIEGRDPIDDYEQINKELANYTFGDLSVLPQIVVANKCDLVHDEKIIDNFEKGIGKKVIRVSAISHIGTDELIKTIFEKLSELPLPVKMEYEPFTFEKEYSKDFQIIKCGADEYEVTGGIVIMLTRNIVLSDYESFAYFQKILKDNGIIKALVKAGVKEGDTVRIADIEFEFMY